VSSESLRREIAAEWHREYNRMFLTGVKAAALVQAYI
jgi:hypothetical protein